MCKDIIECILIVLNVLFLLVSSALIIFGALLQWGGTAIKSLLIPNIVKLVGISNQSISLDNLSQILNRYTDILSNAGLIIFIIGVILFVICISGTCGACCHSFLLMITYLVFVLIIWILIVIFIIVFFTIKSKLKDEGAIEYSKFLQKSYLFNNRSFETSTGLDLTGVIDIIQANAKCCGAFNFTDFIYNSGYNKSYGIIPSSCCIMKDQKFNPLYENCTSTPTLENSYMEKGCYNYLWDIIDTYSRYATYGLIGLGTLLFILIIVAGILLKKYRDKKK